MFPLRDNVVNVTTPVVMYAILALNVLVFLGYGLNAETYKAAIFNYGTIPVYLTTPGPDPQPIPAVLTLLTSMFMHGGWMHLFGNMYFLYLFGDNVQERMGKLSFLGFYLITGIIAGLAHVFINAGSEVPAVGASGAISGILGAYMVMFPRAMVRTLLTFFIITVVDVPAIFFLLLWFAGQLLGGVQAFIAPESVGIAFMAHIGGFVAGAVLARFWPMADSSEVIYQYLNGSNRYY